MTTPISWTPNSLDQQIWQEELDAFVPAQVFDIHVHFHHWGAYLDPNKESGPHANSIKRTFPIAGWDVAEALDAALLPNRRVERLAFPFPYPRPHDLSESNRFVAAEVAGKTGSGGLMMVTPDMEVTDIEKAIRANGFLGLKPYLIYADAPVPAEARITDFLPEAQIALADRMGLLIMMHLSKRLAVSDPDNIRDLKDLTSRYPNAKWILAHCARSYAPWAIEAAAAQLRDIPNIWYDTSTVCESDALDALYQGVDAHRVMYGSDDMIGPLRGKYITFGKAWTYLGPDNHSLNLSHCDGRMTFIRYEMLRAMKRGAARTGLDASGREALFYGTAKALVSGVARALAEGA